MLANLLKHVVKESETRLYVTLARTVEVKPNVNVSLLCSASHRSSTFTSKEKLSHLIP
jgi:hypothetical protein